MQASAGCSDRVSSDSGFRTASHERWSTRMWAFAGSTGLSHRFAKGGVAACPYCSKKCVSGFVWRGGAAKVPPKMLVS
jgi:hypothetical protein